MSESQETVLFCLSPLLLTTVMDPFGQITEKLDTASEDEASTGTDTPVIPMFPYDMNSLIISLLVSPQSQEYVIPLFPCAGCADRLSLRSPGWYVILFIHCRMALLIVFIDYPQPVRDLIEPCEWLF